MELDRVSADIKLDADDSYRLQAVIQILREKMARRKVPLKNLDMGEPEEGGAGRARMGVSPVTYLLNNNLRAWLGQGISLTHEA